MQVRGIERDFWCGRRHRGAFQWIGFAGVKKAQSAGNRPETASKREGEERSARRSAPVFRDERNTHGPLNGGRTRTFHCVQCAVIAATGCNTDQTSASFFGRGLESVIAD
jgi:hypothetical protein